MVERRGGTARERRSIVVTGTGRVVAEPDLAELRLGVSISRASVGEARDEAGRTMAAVLGAVEAAGVERRDVRTTLLSVQPRYDYRDGSQPTLVGYELVNVVTVVVRDLSILGDVVDGTLRAGATSVDGLSIRLEDVGPADREARVRAMAEARTRADVLAEAAELEITGVLEVVEGTPVRPPMPFAKAERIALAAGADSVPTPTEAGMIEVAVSVTVTFAAR